MTPMIARFSNEGCDSTTQQRCLVQFKKLRGTHDISTGLADVTQELQETCALLA